MPLHEADVEEALMVVRVEFWQVFEAENRGLANEPDIRAVLFDGQIVEEEGQIDRIALLISQLQVKVPQHP